MKKKKTFFATMVAMLAIIISVGCGSDKKPRIEKAKPAEKCYSKAEVVDIKQAYADSVLRAKEKEKQVLQDSLASTEHQLRADSLNQLLKSMPDLSVNAGMFEDLNYRLTWMDDDLHLEGKIYVLSNGFHGYTGTVQGFDRGSMEDITLNFKEGKVLQFVEDNITYLSWMSSLLGYRGLIKGKVDQYLAQRDWTQQEKFAYEAFFEKVKNLPKLREDQSALDRLYVDLGVTSDDQKSYVLYEYKEWSFWKRRQIDGTEGQLLATLKYVQKHL